MWHLEHVKSSMSELCVFSTVEYRERAGHVGFNSRDGPSYGDGHTAAATVNSIRLR